MTTDQYIAIAAPILANATPIGLLAAKIGALEKRVDAQFSAQERYNASQFAAMNSRFDDMRDLWRAELHRVEGILDARLKHLEGR